MAARALALEAGRNRAAGASSSGQCAQLLRRSRRGASGDRACGRCCQTPHSFQTEHVQRRTLNSGCTVAAHNNMQRLAATQLRLQLLAMAAGAAAAPLAMRTCMRRCASRSSSSDMYRLITSSLSH